MGLLEGVIWVYGTRGGAEMGCNGDTNQVSNILEGVLGFLRSAEPGKDNRQRFSSPDPIFSDL